MTARTLATLAAVVLPPLLTGCDDEPVGSNPDLIVENAASVSISQVYIRDCPVKFWGENRLDDNEVIAAGERRPFNVGAGCYDLLVYFSTDRTTDRHNLEVPEDEPVLWTANHPAFLIQN